MIMECFSERHGTDVSLIEVKCIDDCAKDGGPGDV